MNRYPRTIPHQFVIGSSGNQTGDPRTIPHQFAIGSSGNQTGDPHSTSWGTSPNHLLEGTIAICVSVPLTRRYVPDGTGADAGIPTTCELHQPPNYPPKLAIQGMLRPHLAAYIRQADCFKSTFKLVGRFIYASNQLRKL